MKLPVVEIFTTLQGEGERSGVPSLFIRLGGCSLRCPGFGYRVEKNGQTYIGCDSIHAVHGVFRDEWRFFEHHKDILDEIRLQVYLFEDVVVTGGVPMLHHTNPILVKLLQTLMEEHEIYIETNGTVEVDFRQYPLYKKVNLTISPKMDVSGEAEYKRIKLDILRSYIDNAKHTVLKIVMGEYDLMHSYEIQSFLQKLLRNVPIYIMPLGATTQELEAIFPKVWDYAMLHGYRVSDRLHVRVFNDKIGV
jgi:organic radical activating enzyme